MSGSKKSFLFKYNIVEPTKQLCCVEFEHTGKKEEKGIK